MSNADQMTMAYAAETTFGVIPTGPSPTLKEIRFTGEGLKQNQTLTPSQQIRDDRQIHDVVRTDAGVTGDINFELSYGSFDDFLEAALQSPVFTSEETKTGTDISAAVAGGQITLTSTVTDFSTLNQYQWVKVTGFPNAQNNGIFKIMSVPTATTLVLQGNTVGAIAQSSGPSITVKQGAQIVNQTTFRSFCFEKEYTDLSPVEFARYTGCAPEGVSMTMTPETIITGTFSFIGKKEESAAVTFGSGPNTPPNTNEVMSAVNSVQSILYKGPGAVNIAQDSTAFNFALANNLRARKRIGELGAISLGSGTVNVTGGLSIYFANEVMMDSYLNSNPISLAVLVMDELGNAYVFDFPAARFSDGQRVAGGQNQDILAAMSFTAFRSGTEGITMRIQRFAA